MPITVDSHTYNFANGDRSNGYPGVLVTSGTAILNTIAQTLDDANWIITDNISSNHSFLAQGTTINGGYPTWVKFVDNQAGTINIYGDATGGNTSLSPAYAVTYPSNGIEARLYVGSREDAGAFSIYRLNNSPNPTMDGAFFGFLERELPTDNTAAFVGNATPEAPYKCHAMKHFVTQQVWRSPASDFSSADMYSSISNNTFPVSGMDLLMGGRPSGNYSNSSATNPWYNFFNGMPNGLTNKYDIAPLLFFEGTGSTIAFGVGGSYLKENLACPKPLYRRGYHPIIFSGFSNVKRGATGEKTNVFGLTKVGLGLGVGKVGMLIDLVEAA